MDWTICRPETHVDPADGLNVLRPDFHSAGATVVATVATCFHLFVVTPVVAKEQKQVDGEHKKKITRINLPVVGGGGGGERAMNQVRRARQSSFAPSFRVHHLFFFSILFGLSFFSFVPPTEELTKDVQGPSVDARLALVAAVK